MSNHQPDLTIRVCRVKSLFRFTKPQPMLWPSTETTLLSTQNIWCAALKKNWSKFGKHQPDTQIRVLDAKLPFSLPKHNTCCGSLKEPSHWNNSFEHPTHMCGLQKNLSKLSKHQPDTQIRVLDARSPFFLPNHNTCFGSLKEPSYWNDSFEHPKYMMCGL